MKLKRDFCWECGKDLYPTEQAASGRIRRLRQAGHHRDRRLPAKPYPCPTHKGRWHLSGNTGNARRPHSGREDRQT